MGCRPYLFSPFFLLAVACVPSEHASANAGCGPVFMTYYGPANLCSAGIPSSALDVTAINEPYLGRQYESEWCWAAAISGIFAYYGHPVAQQEIVQQAYGTIANLPGTPQAIMATLNRTWRDDNGNTFTVTSDIFSSTWETAAQDLASNMPLIVASLGHAMIMTASTYIRYQSGAGVTQAVTVRDPWPYNPMRRYLSPQEMMGVQMLIRIRVR